MDQTLNSFPYPTVSQLLRHRPNIYTTPTTDHTGVYTVYRMSFRRICCLPHSFPCLRGFLSGKSRQGRGVGVQPPHSKHTMYPLVHRSVTKQIQSKPNEKENRDKRKSEGFMGFAALIKTFTACHSRVYAAYRIQFRDYALSSRAKPAKAGGWGCNPHTENTRRVLFYTGPRPNETKPKQTKPNGKEDRVKRKPKV